MSKPYVEVSFFNTGDAPVKIGPVIGYFVGEKSEPEQRMPILTLQYMREYFYQHPDAPGDAVIAVKRVDSIRTATESDPDYAAIMALYMAQKTVHQQVKYLTG